LFVPDLGFKKTNKTSTRKITNNSSNNSNNSKTTLGISNGQNTQTATNKQQQQTIPKQITMNQSAIAENWSDGARHMPLNT
jgi:hypothetical protein